MKYVDEFRDRKLVGKVADAIRREVAAGPKRRYRFMEVCGTHTMNIFRLGLRSLLPAEVELVSGPGCPVCVTPNAYLDKALWLARRPDVIITVFGDLLRVPGSSSSLEAARAGGASVKPVYSSLDALEIARADPSREVVFLGVGFETTAPTVAQAIIIAKREGLRNFSVLCGHKTMPEALRLLAADKRIAVDGFLLPGHVTAITGIRPYGFLPRRYRIGCAVAGFEPLDIMQAILLLVRQGERPALEIEYRRIISPAGNRRARESLRRVFAPVPSEWRGIGRIRRSGLAIRGAFRAFDAEAKFRPRPAKPRERRGCICGAVLTGAKRPVDCELFGKACTPEHPVGSCMVSSEGTCAAWYIYRGKGQGTRGKGQGARDKGKGERGKNIVRDKILLAHGSGGRMTQELIDSLFVKALDNPILRERDDAGLIAIGGKKFAFTTDAYVVDPVIFPGGDIGSLAIHGTVNDLAVCGARPAYIALGIIIEEGLDRALLARITASIARAARRAGVAVVTGDTKVVGRGACDKLFITTSGIGPVYREGLSVRRIRPGDAIIVTGTIGDHAVAILSEREGMRFGGAVRSDSAPLAALIRQALRSSRAIRFMRDPTRGGVATVLCEMAGAGRFGIAIDESRVPLSPTTREACELLGLDPLYLACEGRAVIVVPPSASRRVLTAVRRDPLGRKAAVIGTVTAEHRGKVWLKTVAGGTRLVDMLSGEQLPRIC